MGEVIRGPWPPVDAPTLSLLALAEHKKVTDRTVRRWVAEEMPHERDARGHLRFSLPRVDAWLEERKAA